MARTPAAARTASAARHSVGGVNSLLEVTPDVSIPLQTDKVITGGVGGSVSYLRGGVAWYPDDSGVYTSHAANEIGQNSDGVFLHPARINTCTNYNAEPDVAVSNIVASSGSVTRVDRTLLLAAAGLSNICPQFAFQYINVSGSQQTVTITGTLGATTNAALGCWAVVLSGDAQMQLSVSGNGANGLSEVASFTRYISEEITSTNALDEFQFVVPAGVTIEWVLNQLETDSESGVCATWPIVTAGATGSRENTTCSFSSDNIPTKNFTYYMEVTPLSEHQMSNSCYLMNLYKDVDNNYFWFTGSASNALFRFRYEAATTQINYSKYTAYPRKSALAFKTNSSEGIVPFCNGSKGNNVFNFTREVDIQGGTCYLGQTTFTNSAQFCGQIANIKVFEGHHSDATVKELTNLNPTDLEDIGQVGIPVYDPVNAERIWAFRYDGTNFDAIQYSDDWGDSWILWHELANTTLEPTLNIDSNGNKYYFTDATNYAQQNMYRVDADTKVETSEVAPSNAKNWSWQGWAWGEDSTGTIFTSFYTLDGVDGQLVWVGTIGGTSWSSKNILVNGTDRHVHSLHVDPSDDKAWVSWGDNLASRGTAWSDDDFATKNDIVDGVVDGPTGLAFTSEGVYISSDIVGGQNYLRSISDDANAVTRWQSPLPFQIAPMYYCRAIVGNPNELWIATRNEAAVQNQCPAIFKLEKTNGISSQWVVKKMILSDDSFNTGSSSHTLSGGLNGLIPAAAPYLFAYRTRDNDKNGGLPALGVYRIQRA